MESRADLDGALIAELQVEEGMLSLRRAADLEEALRSSRKIGAAIGIVMARRGVTQEVAFAVLVQASNDNNRKLRLIAEDVVRERRAPRLGAGRVRDAQWRQHCARRRIHAATHRLARG